VVTEFEYTDRGQLALEATEFDSRRYETEYTYDVSGNIDTVTTPAGTVVDYAYTGARVSEVDVTYGAQTETIENLIWLPFGPLEDADFPAGAELRRSFNLRYQLVDLEVKDTATTPNTLVDRKFTYDYTTGSPGPDDPGPNLDKVVDNLDSSESHFYFYDELDRLDKVTDLSGTTQFDYAYDSAGNRTQKVNAAGTTNYTFESGTDRLASATGAEAAYFANNAYGNRIYKGATAYTGTPNHTYNEQNRLVTAPDGQQTPIEAIYDAFGRRVAWGSFVFSYDQAGRLLEVTQPSAPAPWFGDLIWVEGELLGRVEDNVAAGESAWIPPVIRPWIPGPHLEWVVVLGAGTVALLLISGVRQRRPGWATAGATLALVLVVGIACSPTGVAFYWIVTDHIGKPIAMTNTPSSGDPVVVWKASYEPFGFATEDLDPDGDSTNIRLPVRFPGQWWDFATGYHYNMFRDYDPVTGRYLEPDPIRQLGGINLYGYAHNSPLNVTDPTAQIPPLVAAFIIGSALGGLLGGLGEYLANVAAGCEGADRLDGVGQAVLAGVALGGFGAVAGVAAAPVLGPVGGAVAGGAVSGGASAAAEHITGGSPSTTTGAGVGAALGGAIAGPGGIVAGEFLGFAGELLFGSFTGDLGADCGCDT
jgi:RHS repeat-associated protein